MTFQDAEATGEAAGHENTGEDKGCCHADKDRSAAAFFVLGHRSKLGCTITLLQVPESYRT